MKAPKREKGKGKPNIKEKRSGNGKGNEARKITIPDMDVLGVAKGALEMGKAGGR